MMKKTEYDYATDVIVELNTSRNCSFKVGEIIHNWLEDFPTTVRQLPRKILELTGRSIGAKSKLQNHLLAYMLREIAGAELSTRLDNMGLEHTHWQKAATARSCLDSTEKLEALTKAGENNWTVGKLRNELVSMANWKHLEQIAVESPSIPGIETENVYLCHFGNLASKLIAEKAVIDLFICDWQWSYRQNITRTTDALPEVYPQGSYRQRMDTALDDLELAIVFADALLAETGILAIHGPVTFEGLGFNRIRRLLAEYFEYSGQIIWDKDHPRMSHNVVSNGTEHIYLYKRAGAVIKPLGNFKNVVAACPGKNSQHPYQKPDVLCERVVQACCRPGGLVFDAYAGSGSYGVVAGKMGRKYIGAEMVKTYASLANGRLQKLKPIVPAKSAELEVIPI